jgi:hypothetical protein
MEIAVMACLAAKRDMDIDASHVYSTKGAHYGGNNLVLIICAPG